MRFELDSRSLLKISGKDAENYLQAQLSNDISKIKTNSIQLNAYCQHQGKILALFWVMKIDDGFFLSFPSSLLEKILPRLKMFVLMSEVLIENVSDRYNHIGLINERHPNAYSINDNLSLLIDSSRVTDNLNHNNLWAKELIDSCIPEVYLASSEKFVPQMLNLDIDEIGVNFSKGCYPGQEVVARLHYLGSAKRRLFSFKADQEMQVGDSLYCATSKTALARGNRYKGSGIVVSKVSFDSLFYCLATLDVDLVDDQITLNNEHGPKLKRINNE